MGKLADTYLKYGVSSDMALKYESIGLSVTTFRVTSISNMVKHYGLAQEEVVWIKKCITRQPIDDDIVQKLLENSNFVCCCCKGIKSDSYIIHHIEEYEISQNNSYDNLAVLCLNDHDLAHRPPKLTNKLTHDQIRKAKISWERQVLIHNIAVSKYEQKQEFLATLPKYNELEQEIRDLKRRIEDKEKIISRSEAYYDLEIEKLRARIEELNSQKSILEEQVTHLVLSLDKTDLSKSSDLYLNALDCLFNGNFDEAMEVLNESKLDSELRKIQQREEELYESLEQNADSWILRAKLKAFKWNLEDAKKSAAKGLQIFKQLFTLSFEKYSIKYIYCLESIGSVYYNMGEYEEAENFFNEGYGVCLKMHEMGAYEHFPLLAIIIQNIGACYYSLGNAEESIKYLGEANSLFSEINEAHGRIEGFDNTYFITRHLLVLANLGTSYEKLGKHRNALEFYLQGNKIIEAKLLPNNDDDYMEPIYVNYSGLGSHYFYSGEYKLAQDFYLKAFPIGQKLFNRFPKRYLPEMANLARDICATYIFAGDFLSAKYYCDEALLLFRQLGSSKGAEYEMNFVDTLVYSAMIILNQEQDLKKAEKLTKEALDICEKYPDNEDARLYPATINALLASLKFET